MAQRAAPSPEGLDHGAGMSVTISALVDAVESVGADLLLVTVHRPDHRQRLGHRLGLGVVRPFKAAPSMGPAQSVGHLPGALPRVGRIRLVAVAEQRAVVLAEKGMDVTVRARRRVVEHHLVGIAVHRPQPPSAHLALRLAPGLDRGLVHRQHPAREYMRALRRGDRGQQVDGAARPVNQGGAAERDAGVAKALMRAVQRQVSDSGSLRRRFVPLQCRTRARFGV